MQHRGRIIHRAVWIDRSTELLFLEPAAYALGKAGTHEEYFFARFHQEARLRDVDDRSELHLYN